MQGVGFLLWRLSNVLPIDETIQKIRDRGVNWVSIKVLDYNYKYNHVNEAGVPVGNDYFLRIVIDKLRNAGISVGGWGFVYTDNTASQARSANAIVSHLGLDHWLIDAEAVPSIGALWKSPGAAAAAKAYCDALNMPGKPVGLCSYRYPSYHREFPFGVFLNHPKVNLIAPQMYWMQAHNPGEQLQRTVREHAPWSHLPVVPIGATFREFGWEPTVADVKEFVQVASSLKLPGYGFWDLDEASKRIDWLDAATHNATPPVPPPPPLPDPDHPEVTAKVMTVVMNDVRVRSAIIPSPKYGPVPGKVYQTSQIWFKVNAGTLVEVFEEIQDGRNIWARIGHRQYIAKLFDNSVFIK